jgi:hypothetical protein
VTIERLLLHNVDKRHLHSDHGWLLAAEGKAGCKGAIPSLIPIPTEREAAEQQTLRHHAPTFSAVRFAACFESLPSRSPPGRRQHSMVFALWGDGRDGPDGHQGHINRE